jgi:hypothetical protein
MKCTNAAEACAEIRTDFFFKGHAKTGAQTVAANTGLGGDSRRFL